MVGGEASGQSGWSTIGRPVRQIPGTAILLAPAGDPVMRRRSHAPLAAAVLLLWSVGTAFAVAPTIPPHAADGTSANPTDRWIVVLKPGTDAAMASAKQGKKAGFKADRLYRHALKGYAAHLTRAQLAAVRADPTVSAIRGSASSPGDGARPPPAALAGLHPGTRRHPRRPRGR